MSTAELPEVAAGERGGVSIADRVVAKVASQAAREALRSTGPAHPAAGPVPRAPRATVTVRERTARVRVALELRYPSDIGAQCEAVRRHVADRVRELVGMEVPEVSVGVERLHSARAAGTGGGRVL